jgi:hypothetical protein
MSLCYMSLCRLSWRQQEWQRHEKFYARAAWLGQNADGPNVEAELDEAVEIGNPISAGLGPVRPQDEERDVVPPVSGAP